MWLTIIFVIMMTVVFMHLCRKMAPYLGLLDRPLEDRKKHIRVTPTVGGIVIFTTLCLSLWLFSGLSFSFFMPLLAGMAGYIAIGVYDDIKHIRPLIKMAWQVAVAIVFVLVTGVKITYLGEIFGLGPLGTGLFAIPFTILCIVALINAFNWIDGLDGLAGGCILGMLVLLIYATPKTTMSPVLIISSATIFGFLMFNMRSHWRKHALVFLGDAGSLSLGFMLSCLVIFLTQDKSTGVLSPIVAAWIISYPIFDMVSCMLNRKLAKKSIYQADNMHAHFLLQTLGCSPKTTSYILVAVSFLYGAVGVLGDQIGIPEVGLAVMWGLGLALHFWVVRLLLNRSKKQDLLAA